MKLRSTSVALAGAVVLAACSDQTVAPVAPTTRAALAASKPASHIVLFKSRNGAPADFARRVATLGGRVQGVFQNAGFALVSGLSDAAVATLAGAADVAEVQPDAEVALDEPASTIGAGVMDAVVAGQSNPTTAALYAWQWNMRLIGVDKAWAAGKLGSPGVTVAILDTGIDYDALDLAGLVDLERSTSLVAEDDALTARYFPSRNRLTDYNGHGTNVASQVSSKAVGLAGVTSKTTLIGVKVLNYDGRGSLGAVLGGVVWAADHGADVANLSLGGGFAKAGYGRYVALINRAFDHAKQKGMLIVVAAGNESENLDANGNELKTYCGVVHVLCVSAVGPQRGSDFGTAADDTPALFTNFGRSSIDVAAPGGNFEVDDAGKLKVSAWPWGDDKASWVWSICSKTNFAKDLEGHAIFNPDGSPILTPCVFGNRLSGFVGTSQATPHVAGLAALLVAEKGHGQPQLIKQAIERSATDLGQPGTDPYYGAGRIDVARALGLR